MRSNAMRKLAWILHLAVSCTAQLDPEELQGKIVGGAEADIIDHPHSAYLETECTIHKINTSWQCSASIINQQILLTAAHCVYECKSSFKIVARIGNRNHGKGLRHRVYSLHIHSNYKPKTTTNDLALLKTIRPIKFNENVKRVALMRDPPYFEQAQIAGWGFTDEVNKVSPSKLQYMNQKVIERDKCKKIIGKLPKGTFCAASDFAMKTAAKGDSGSALVVRGYIQLGILSFKRNQIQNNINVYTDVAHFYDWIKHRARRLYCSK